MKYLLMFDTPLWMMLSGGLGTYVVMLRRRMAGFKEPVMYLSKGERRAWARKELKEREEERNAEQMQRNMDIMYGKKSD